MTDPLSRDAAGSSFVIHGALSDRLFCPCDRIVIRDPMGGMLLAVGDGQGSCRVGTTHEDMGMICSYLPSVLGMYQQLLAR